MPFKDFVEGGTVGFLIRLNGLQIVALGSMNFIERELAGLHPDVALVASDPLRHEIYDYTGRRLRALDFPPLVVATHWDSSQLPLGSPFTKQLKDADEFAAEVRAAVSAEPSHHSTSFRVDQILTKATALIRIAKRKSGTCLGYRFQT